MRYLLFAFFLSFCGCNHLFYYPSKEIFYPPENLKITYQSIKFTSQDGTNLSGWYFPTTGKKAKGTVVQFHGNAQNMTSHYLSVVWLVKEGYNLFTFDYRGYGESEGTPNQKGTVLDGTAALKKAWELHDKKSPFIVWGQSLGGAVLQASLANFPNLSDVRLIILESTFNSYRKVSYTLIKNGYLWFLSPLAWVLISDRYSGKNYMKKNKIPLLVVHDENDQTVPFANAKDILEINPGSEELWQLKMGGHLRAFAPDQDPRRQQLVQFLSTFAR